MMAQQRISGPPTLSLLLEGLVYTGSTGDLLVTGICIDSREVVSGDLFIALEGSRTSGVKFIEDAVKHGAAGVLIDAQSALKPDSVTVPLYKVTDLHSNVGLIASRFYADPSGDMFVTGITGTNGKTSIAWYLGQALSAGNTKAVGSIGTLGYGEFGRLMAANNTTPDALTVQRLLDQFRTNHIRDVVMEVSSHALDQGRVNNVSFSTAIFTNLTRDHLDYHTDMAAYGSAKKKLFMSPGLQNAVINADDDFGVQLINELSGRLNIISYGLKENQVTGKRPGLMIGAIVRKQKLGLLELEINSPWGSGCLTTSLSGRFNAYNLLATLAVLCLREIPFVTALQYLSAMRGVPGRMEYFGNQYSPAVVVDYAHTPDALLQVLLSLREQCTGRLVCVFGCGGDRDRGKRAQMGRVAESMADHVILTSDNPRTESPDAIIHDILSGMAKPGSVEIQTDRVLAIRTAIDTATTDDVILIAGKGHETYQEIGTQKLPFSDRQMVRNVLEQTK